VNAEGVRREIFDAKNAKNVRNAKVISEGWKVSLSAFYFVYWRSLNKALVLRE